MTYRARRVLSSAGRVRRGDLESRRVFASVRPGRCASMGRTPPPRRVRRTEPFLHDRRELGGCAGIEPSRIASESGTGDAMMSETGSITHALRALEGGDG